MADDQEISAIRDASRRLVRELGFMKPTLAGTDLPASAVHAIIEIGRRQQTTAADLAEILNLEKSSISRMIRKLIDAGELAEAVAAHDARSKLLSLTPRGRTTLAQINAFAQRQVCGAVDRLPAAARKRISTGLETYARALERQRTGEGAPSSPASIVSGYHTGLVGRCVDMHARYYAETAGFGPFFVAQIAAGLADFITRSDRPRNGVWTAFQDGEIVGTVAIDGEDLGSGAAHLRWFIVDDRARGVGIGRRLLAEAVAFCDRQGFPETELWTFAGLDAARHLYECYGFTLVEQRPGTRWGTEVLEQRYLRKAPTESSVAAGRRR